MTRVFIHGNPETAAIWGPLLDELRERGESDLVCLSAPGFGAPRPSDFDASPSSYVGWLVGELEQIDGPIDLVGHDWGAGHVYGLLAQRPDLARSWAADCAGLVHPEYVWHDMAQAWQTDELGEQVVEMMMAGAADERVARFVELGIPEPVAAALVADTDPSIGGCILDLYRGAAQPVMADLGRALLATELPRGLVLDATGDAYSQPALGRDMAERFGASVFTMEGEGHWWMCSVAGAAADGLVEFWSTLD